MLAEDIARAREPLERAWTLPPGAYTQPQIFAAERGRIFEKDWICVARADQLPEVGDFLCVDLLDQPIVVVRGRDRALRALSRVCLHRAMPVVEGSGNTTRFVCPYHHWTYELDGQLRSAPMMEGCEDFLPGDCRLPMLRLEEWQGFVFVNQDSDANALSPQLKNLAQRIEHYDYGELIVVATTEYDSPWNWKILVENFMEAYHHIGIHQNTFQPIYPARASTVPDNEGQPWTYLQMPCRAGREEAHESAVFPRLEGAERYQLLAMNVYPTLLFAATQDGGVWYQLEPRAHDAMHLKIHYLLPRQIASQLDTTARTAIVEGLRFIHEEDIAANEGPWRGLQAGLTVQGRLSTFEKAIWQLNQLWLDRMEAHL